MNHANKLAALALALPLLAGCAGRVAPFNELDKAPMTVLRLGQPPAAQQPAAQQPGAMPSLIPGLPIPPELQQLGQQAAQGLQQALPGLIPPGLLPGATPAQPQQPQQPQFGQFKSFAIVQQPIQLTDESLRDEILDIFGKESSFSPQRGNCFSPGMGVSISRNNAPPVDLLISLSCNQAMGDGFRWPHPNNGFTTETHDRLAKLYEKLFGPIPPGA